MSFESTSAGTASTENTEREDFAKAEARLDEIKKMSLDELSDDEAEAILAERKALRAQKTEMVGNAQDEATMENQKIDALEQQKAEAERASAEALAEAQRAEEKARALAERQQEDAEKIATLRAGIVGEEAERGGQETQGAGEISPESLIKVNEIISIKEQMKFANRERQEAEGMLIYSALDKDNEDAFLKARILYNEKDISELRAQQSAENKAAEMLLFAKDIITGTI